MKAAERMPQNFSSEAGAESDEEIQLSQDVLTLIAEVQAEQGLLPEEENEEKVNKKPEIWSVS